MELDMQKYIKIRMAQCKGARTLDKVKAIFDDIDIANKTESAHIEAVLKNACKCHNLSIEDVLNAIKNGADTIEKLVDTTKIGTCCGRCKPLVDNMLETRR